MHREVKFAALLPMKGHSERVKNKNLRNFNGIPLFQHILRTLDGCEYVKDIYIDTDSSEIAELAEKKSLKVRIIDRPMELRGDMVSMNDIIKYDLSVIDNDYFIQTHSTNPLLKIDTLSEACKKYIENMEIYDSVFSVTRLQTRLYDKYAKAVNHDPGNLIRTQDLEPLYEENSNFYIFSKESFLKTNARIGSKPQMYEVKPLEAVDIDEESDFILAELIQRANIL